MSLTGCRLRVRPTILLAGVAVFVSLGVALAPRASAQKPPEYDPEARRSRTATGLATSLDRPAPETATAPGGAIPGARPGAYTELLLVLRVVGAAPEDELDLAVSYPDDLLGPLRIVSEHRSWKVSPASPGRFRLRRPASSDRPLPSDAHVGEAAFMPLPQCENAEQGEWVAHVALQVRAPQETSPGDLSLSVPPRHAEGGEGSAHLCAASSVFRTRALVPGVGGRP
jgi:hypothetical protein